MKFAKELDQDLVPEWRMKYVNYKAGKKRIKAVSKAVNRMNQTPRTPAGGVRPDATRNRSLYGATSPVPQRSKLSQFPSRHSERADNGEEAEDGPHASLRGSPAAMGLGQQPDSENFTSEEDIKALPRAIPAKKKGQDETNEINADPEQYGSFVPTPPSTSRNFELPDAALSTPDLNRPVGKALRRSPSSGDQQTTQGRSSSQAVPKNAYEIGQTQSPHRSNTFKTLRNRWPSMQRVLSVGSPMAHTQSQRMDVNLEATDQVRLRQKEFFSWMDGELEKVGSFYRVKEDEAGERLKVLREQLHEMRNRRIEEVAAAQRAKTLRQESEHGVFGFYQNGHSKKDDDHRPGSRDALDAWLDPVKSAIETARASVLGPHPGANSKALQKMHDSPEMRAKSQAERNTLMESAMDYVRRPHYEDDVPYRIAKKKLKLALQEFYRGMELLKSFALLNRTAFRKINKKYDKAVDAHPPLRYMADKVNKAWFVQSEVLDGHIHAVEDLYARYFERGNHKIAVGKLRSSSGRTADRSFNAFQNGILIGVGAVFAIQGVIYGRELLFHPDPTIRTETSYLLQIYAAYFLALYLFSFFCLDCSIFTRNKINYQFIFEFDTRHSLDWRQLSEFPAFLFFVFGFFMWVNFARYGAVVMYLFYPVILAGVSAVIIFFPAPILFHRSRKWFVYSHWRLLCAGLYPVEFRDFFLGDMYCSLTYMMSNIELYFCLYAHDFNNPTQCNSTHSRLLGFFSALPGIWRLLQCFRRYCDTRAVFPHLVNGGKYLATICYYMTLSLYRINQTNTMLAVFVVFATLNAIYTSIWDLLMDWSLLQPNASKRWLRDVRGFKNPNYYYAAMILDPILRFNWIFYALFTHDIRHGSIVSFMVAFSECTRRGIWVLFRVENEHCSNVRRFKASRDVPLPYTIPTSSDSEGAQTAPSSSHHNKPKPTEDTPISPSLSRHRSRASALEEGESGFVKAARTFTQIVADAHKQDFEKKRKPGAKDDDGKGKGGVKNDGEEDEGMDGVSSSDDGDEGEDEDCLDTQDVLDAEALIRERRGGGGGGYFERG